MNAQSINLEVIKSQLTNGFLFNELSRRVATITHEHNKNFRVAYFGFDSHFDAIKFTQWLIQQGYDFELRVSKRMSTRLEVKVKGMSKALIGELAKKDLRQHPSNVIQFPTQSKISSKKNSKKSQTKKSQKAA